MNATQQTVEPVNELGHEVRRINPFADQAAGASNLALQAGTSSAIAREEAEIKAAMSLARMNRRNPMDCWTAIMKSCDRARFAEAARYKFPRGGTDVIGPSIDMAREMARCWGNIRYGLRLVTVDKEYVHIKGYAIDLETNMQVENEDKFRKLIQRTDKHTKQTQWLEPDERDLRELINRRGAICVRNSILQLMPPDIVDDAMVQVGQTLEKVAAGELNTDRLTVVKTMVYLFSEVGVTAEMLEGRIGGPLNVITPEQVADLRSVYKSIRDGQAKREEYFGESAKAETPPSSGNKGDDLAAKLAAEKAAKSTKTDPKPAADKEQPPPPTSAEDAAKFQAAVGVIKPGEQGTLLPQDKQRPKR